MPRCLTIIYTNFKLLGNLFDLCQVSLPKIAKHWDGFLSDCRVVAHGWGLLPTKTSCMDIQLFGRLLSLVRTFSQVFTTSLVNPLFCLIFNTVILSLVSLEFIECSHFDLICCWLWIFLCITLLQHVVHTKYVDSERRIWRRQDAPLRWAFLWCCSWSMISWGTARLPQLLRSGGLKVRLAQGNYVGEFKGKGGGRVFRNDQRWLRGFEGTRGEAIQERWIENQVKLRAWLLLEVGLYIHEGR